MLLLYRVFVLDRNTVKYRSNAVFAKVSSYLDVSPKKKVAVISLVSFLDLNNVLNCTQICQNLCKPLQSE